MDLQLKAYYEQETSASLIDSLTGLFNHGFFQVSLEREIERSKRFGPPLSLAMIDIDSYSSFNERYGHIKGDQILKKIAVLIMKNIRQVDLAARYSNDVFALVVADANTQSALIVLERIRRAVEKIANGDITISGGIASYPDDATDGLDLIQKAQEALVRAKIRGKNRVYIFENESKPIDYSMPRILVVDDDPLNVELLEDLLSPLNYEVFKALNGEDALSIVREVDPDVVLLDIMMPVMDGFEVCRRLKKDKNTRLIPIIMLTALDDLDSKVDAIESGADEFITKPPNKIELLTRIKSLIKTKSLNRNLASIEEVLFSLANTVEAKDAYTQGHVERVANMALTIGRKLGLSGREIEALRYGGILHDIGKIVVPENILNKPGALDPEERKLIEAHPDAGYKIALPLKKNLGEALDIIRHHHEKLDGSGYPGGLKEKKISKGAKIMAAVDIYDALITDRPYHKAMPKDRAFEILWQEVREGKLDKRIVEALIEIAG